MSRNSSEQKTERPTPKRLREARKKGQVAFSRDASGIVVFAVAIFVVFGSARLVASGFAALFEQARELAALDQVNAGTLHGATREALALVLRLMLPLAVTTFAAAVAIGLIQTRFVFSLHPLKPKLENLSPIRRLKQWFSVQGLFEYAKTWLKLVAVIALAWGVIGTGLGFVLKLGFADTGEIIAVLSTLSQRFLVWVTVIFFGLGALDFLFQHWKWNKDLKMGRHELKQELKQTEGEPLIKSRRRSLHQQISFQDVEKAVIEAQVVLVNPTHLAVALRYERGVMPAPRVTAKGRFRAAERIRALAARHGKPVVRNVPLARALMEVEIEGMVPRDLFVAVAEVLNSIEQMRVRRQAAAGGGA